MDYAMERALLELNDEQAERVLGLGPEEFWAWWAQEVEHA